MRRIAIRGSPPFEFGWARTGGPLHTGRSTCEVSTALDSAEHDSVEGPKWTSLYGNMQKVDLRV